MKEILILECAHGYKFDLENDQIIYEHVEDLIPYEHEVRPLFQAIQVQRKMAFNYLETRSQPVDIAGHLRKIQIPSGVGRKV